MAQQAYDYAVVGAGLIGSAAARHLIGTDARVLVIGPDEPSNWWTHHGVFASHYDEGRITRIVDPDPCWALLARRAMAAYSAIEHSSRIRFHHPCGALRVGPESAKGDDILAASERIGRRLGAPVRRLTCTDLGAAFPALAFPAASAGLWERGGAGYVNPRALIAAQLRIGDRWGVTRVHSTVTGLGRRRGRVELHCEDGQVHRARRVLISAGAFANRLLDDRLDLRVRPATVLMTEVDMAERVRLRAMPAIISQLVDHPLFRSFYCLPPMGFPDGRHYIKIGGTPHEPTFEDDAERHTTWFHGEGSEEEGAALREVLAYLIPSLRVETTHTRPCILAFTAHDRPYIGQVDDDVFVAVGGNGAAAKSSTEIGRIAARLVVHGEWAYDIGADHFRVETVAHPETASSA